MSMEPEASFRARKRQKVYRKRFDEDDDLQQQPRQDSGSNRSSAAAPTRLASAAGAAAASRHTDEETTATATAALPPAPAQSAEPHNDDVGLSVAEIMRRRKQKARGLGVEFTSNSMRSGGGGGGGGSSGGTEISTAPPPSAAVASSEDAERLEAAAKRFAPQTGMVADTLDKHMMAYIDSKMAEMRREGERAAAAAAAAAAATNGGPAFSDGQYGFGQGEQQASTVAMNRQRQPAGMGKLMEIDLGPEAARRNIERTEEATRRLQNGGTLDQMDEQQGKGRRGRKRRTSEDIKRDKLVEEILRESRQMLVDIYDDPEQKQQQQQGGPDPNDGEAADDRIVEQFRREFMEAVQNRNNRRPPASAANKAGKGGKADERPKGPKLGGSRSARAAMRAMEEKNAKKR